MRISDWSSDVCSSDLVDRSGRLLHLIEGFVPEAEWLGDGETLTYLHSCVSTNRQRVRVPETPVYLDALLTDQPLVGGLTPRLGEHHLRTLTITGFPTATWPGRSEEHTSELQSLMRISSAVFCLKKK